MSHLLTSRMFFETSRGPIFHSLESNIAFRRFRLLASVTEGEISDRIAMMPPIELPEFAKERSADAVKRQDKADSATDAD